MTREREPGSKTTASRQGGETKPKVEHRKRRAKPEEVWKKNGRAQRRRAAGR